MYVVYQDGKACSEYEFSKIADVEDYHHGPKSHGQAVFNDLRPNVKGVWPSEGTYLIFEVLARIVNPLKLFIQQDIEGDGNGYPLDRLDEQAGVGLSKWETPDKMRPIGFSVLPLFCEHGELNRGLFKVPVYQLPTWRAGMPD